MSHVRLFDDTAVVPFNEWMLMMRDAPFVLLHGDICGLRLILLNVLLQVTGVVEGDANLDTWKKIIVSARSSDLPLYPRFIPAHPTIAPPTSLGTQGDWRSFGSGPHAHNPG